MMIHAASLVAVVMLSLAGPAAAPPPAKESPPYKKLPDKPVVKLNLKPDSEVADLIGWISGITCNTFVVPSTLSIKGRKVTVHSPNPMTPSEAYQLFVNALESVNLTVEPSGNIVRIVELKKPPR